MDKQTQEPTVSEVSINIASQNERMYYAGLTVVMLDVVSSNVKGEVGNFALLESTHDGAKVVGYGNASEIEKMASAYASGAIQVLTRWQKATATATTKGN